MEWHKIIQEIGEKINKIKYDNEVEKKKRLKNRKEEINERRKRK